MISMAPSSCFSRMTIDTDFSVNLQVTLDVPSLQTVRNHFTYKAPTDMQIAGPKEGSLKLKLSKLPRHPVMLLVHTTLEHHASTGGVLARGRRSTPSCFERARFPVTQRRSTNATRLRQKLRHLCRTRKANRGCFERLHAHRLRLRDTNVLLLGMTALRLARAFFHESKGRKKSGLQ